MGKAGNFGAPDLQTCWRACRSPVCTVYAVEALQALALAGADARQHLEVSAADWGPLVWNLVLAEPENWKPPVGNQIAYWVWIFGTTGVQRVVQAVLHQCTERVPQSLYSRALQHPDLSWHVGCRMTRQEIATLTWRQLASASKVHSSLHSAFAVRRLAWPD